MVIKGTGSRVENETVIVFNDFDPIAIVNTASPSVFRRMAKRGFVPVSQTPSRARFEIPKGRVRLPSQPRKKTGPNPPSKRAFPAKKADPVAL